MMKVNNVARALRPLAGKRMFSSFSSQSNQKFSSLSVEYDSDEHSGLDANVKYTSVTGSPRQLCDFELIANGGFAPLDGFLNQTEYENVCSKFRLSNGALWPIPINMDIDAKILAVACSTARSKASTVITLSLT